MSKKCNTITGVLRRKGTDQLLRNKLELDPGSIELMDFDVEDWMKFAYNFAKHVNYFNEENSRVADGDWRSFFKDNAELKVLLENLDQSNSLTPHLTLFICFLKLLDFSKERFNRITKRHLDFFYTEILKIEKEPAQSDTAYIVFELAKSFEHEKLSKGLGLNGGKDADGKQLRYELTEELVANKAKIAQLKNIYYHKSGSLEEDEIELDTDPYMRISRVANSFGGNGEDFPGEDVSWLPFGYYQEDDDPDIPAMEKATIGFSFASDILKLTEGERHIQFFVNFEEFLSEEEIPAYHELNESVQVFYTIANKWQGPIGLIQKKASETIETSIVPDFDTVVEGKTAKFYVKLQTKDEATSAYNPEIHLGKLTTESPVFRFLIDVNSESGIKVFNAFSNVITDLRIEVGVTGVRQLLLDSDSGKLNPTKPMFPFTANPIKGSSLVIDHSEIFSKNWKSIGVEMKWMNAPNDFKKWYEAYQKELITNLSPQVYSNSQIMNREIAAADGGAPTLESGVDLPWASGATRFMNTAGDNPIIEGPSDFLAVKSVKKNNQWEFVPGPDVKDSTTSIFNIVEEVGDPEDNELSYKGTFSIDNPAMIDETAGPIKLSLDTSFLHSMYPQLYAIALSSNDSYQLIPNKPYTPLCEEIIVSYTAEEEISLAASTEDDFENKKITLFHERPFGHTIEHNYLREKHNAPKKFCTLVPRVEKGGELYIGLENAVNLQTVSLFIQLLEGSENPEVDTFGIGEGEEVEWEVLCSDYWQKLDTIAIKMDEIDNFLKSGLVRIEIPKEATKDNMQLDNSLIWIKAVMPKSYDAVCRVLSISTQGAKSIFVNNDNELSHLEKGLPAESIGKLVERISSVKTVSQPYNSFGGKPKEDDASYYKRVSERLRHKNRAIMLWDYENIILQEFQDIYRVKCLNHTSKNSFLAAGCVTVVVVPNTVNKNMFNILQPRVSTATLNRINKHVSQLTSLHVKLDIINPDYEEVKININVRFHSQFDRVLYKIQLNEDLKKFLSPWAFDDAKNVEFGVTLHRSVLIDYVERLPYVDYILSIDMKIGQNGLLGDSVKNATPSSPKAILVSAEEHDITADKDSVETVTTIETEC